ncbi:hypothetical protein bcgnr5380_57240 [Bacillus cereus]
MGQLNRIPQIARLAILVPEGLCASAARAHGGPTSDQLTSPLKEFLRVQNLLRETMYPLPFR